MRGIEGLEAVFVQLATTCNGRCLLCPHRDAYGPGGHPRARMSEETWTALLSGILLSGFRGQVGLYLHHEPLTAPEVFDRIRQVRCETEAFAAISTNCSLLGRENRRRLIEAGPRMVFLHVPSARRTQFGYLTGLDFDTVVSNARAFAAEAPPEIKVQVVSPAFRGFNPDLMRELFPGVEVICDFWAVSRGGGVGARQLLEPEGKKTRYNDFGKTCYQPVKNLCVLADGGTLVCSNDWAHETKGDYPNINDRACPSPLEALYLCPGKERDRGDFARGDYSRRHCCSECAPENGFDRR